MSEVKLSKEQIKQLKDSLTLLEANRKNIDKFELTGADVKSLREDNEKAIADIKKTLQVYGE